MMPKVMLLKEQFTQKIKPLIIDSPPYRCKVRHNFVVYKTFLELHSKIVLQNSLKQMK